MPGIFICYRREDSGPSAGRLYDWLNERFGKDKVFFDIEGIPLGADFLDVIQERVSNCDALIVVIGRTWSACVDEYGVKRLQNPKDSVRVEATAALDRNICVIPVLVGGRTCLASRTCPILSPGWQAEMRYNSASSGLAMMSKYSFAPSNSPSPLPKAKRENTPTPDCFCKLRHKVRPCWRGSPLPNPSLTEMPSLIAKPHSSHKVMAHRQL